MDIFSEETGRLLMALGIGGIIGSEREFSSKAAGFRTMILICVGSAMFTMLSTRLGADRIAANIITGIGFIGAGVVFKDGFNVIGLTTAATIWITAALGMTIGAGEYRLAAEGAALTLIVLFLFEYIQLAMIRVHHKRNYKIVFYSDKLKASDIEARLQQLPLKYLKRAETKNNDTHCYSVDVFGSKEKLEAFNEYLLGLDMVRSFEG